MVLCFKIVPCSRDMVKKNTDIGWNGEAYKYKELTFILGVTYRFSQPLFYLILEAGKLKIMFPRLP